MAMKCPNCGAENPEDKRFCGDCGATICQLREAQHRHTRVLLSRGLGATLIVVAVIAVAVMIVLAIVLASGFGETESPKEVFAEWIDSMNDRDPMGAADLTIFSKMGMSTYLSQAETLAGYLEDMDTYDISSNHVIELSKGELRDQYHYIDIILQTLEYSYEIEIDDWCGLDTSISVYQNGDWDIWADSWPCFKIGTSWYLGYTVESVL